MHCFDLLFSHFLELLSENGAAIAIKRDVQPIPFLALDNKFLDRKVLGPRLVFTGLCDNIDHQVPGSRLAYLCQRTRDRLLCFVRCCESRHRCGGLLGKSGDIRSSRRRATGTCRFLHDCLSCGESVCLGN